jgi:hypothetical protein
VADDQLHALDGKNSARVLAIRDEYAGLLKQVLDEGQRRSGWRVPDVPVISFAIATMATGVGVWFRESGRFSPQEVARIYGDFVLAAVEPSPGEAVKPAFRNGKARTRSGRARR